MKKIIILIIILLLTGCNSYIELNDLGIIQIIGLEKIDNNYKLTTSIIEKVDEDTNPIISIYNIEGNTIPELFNKLSLSLNKKIYLSHLDTLIINDSIKTNELENIINFFLNNNESRNDFLIITTNDISNIINNTKSENITDLVKLNEKENSQSIYTTMYDLINNYYNKKPIYLTNIKYQDKLFINGITKIEHNKHIQIDEDKSIIINYLLNNINTYKINLKCDNNKFLYLNILSSNTNYLNNKLLITNEIKVITNDCNLNKDIINKTINNYLKDNLKEFTNKKITINNTIRGIYENK